MMHMMPKGERTITFVHMGHGFSALVDTTFLRAMWCKISVAGNILCKEPQRI